jgi:hypothetical protein
MVEECLEPASGGIESVVGDVQEDSVLVCCCVVNSCAVEQFPVYVIVCSGEEGLQYFAAVASSSKAVVQVLNIGADVGGVGCEAQDPVYHAGDEVF